MWQIKCKLQFFRFTSKSPDLRQYNKPVVLAQLCERTPTLKGDVCITSAINNTQCKHSLATGLALSNDTLDEPFRRLENIHHETMQ